MLTRFDRMEFANTQTCGLLADSATHVRAHVLHVFREKMLSIKF